MFAERRGKAIGMVVLGALIACGALAMRWCYKHTRGVEIRLHNVENIPLRSVEVAVTGKTYSIGDIAAGTTKSVWVKPTSESSVDVTFVTSTGAKHVPVDSYIEPSYSGWISADLTAAGARNVEDHVEMY